MQKFMQNLVEQVLPEAGAVVQQESVGGGCISDAFRVETEHYGPIFVKLNDEALSHMMETEHQALLEMAQSQTVNVPEPLAFGHHGSNCYLMLQWLNFAPLSGKAETHLGATLALMHKAHGERHGWRWDNFIGAIEQRNEPDDNWVRFYTEQRLAYQYELAKMHGLSSGSSRAVGRLLDRLPSWFTQHKPAPSMLHGDLWSGNASGLASGESVIYDPAFYYGDRETDLAMMELFGGFGERCMAAYQEIYPIDEGYMRRKPLYQLYHVLNHFNLFGGPYDRQVQQLAERCQS